MFWIRGFKFAPDIGLVNRSARFSEVCSFAILNIPAATASLTLWYAMELCFFFKVDVGTVEFVTADLLSQNTLVGPSIGIPIILNLYRSASRISTRVLMAMNSEPKVLASTVLCALEYQMVG
jgi:hypothetical protein